MKIIKSAASVNLITWVPPYSNEIIFKDNVRNFCKLISSGLNLVNSSDNAYSSNVFNCQFDFCNFDIVLTDLSSGKTYKTNQTNIKEAELTWNYNIFEDESFGFSHVEIKFIFNNNNFEQDDDFIFIKDKLSVNNTFVDGESCTNENIHKATLKCFNYLLWR